MKFRPVNEVQSFLMKRRNEMRLHPTPAEAALASRLTQEGIRHVFQSIKFSRGVYRIFDFFIPKHRLVIEVDGEYHRRSYDTQRDAEVKKANRRLKILRFTNREVLGQLDAVIQSIKEVLK